MKTNYENWMPKELINYLKYSSLFSGLLFVGLSIYIIIRKNNGLEYIHWISIVATLFLILALVLLFFTFKFNSMRKKFDFENPNSVAWKIINFVADSIKIGSGKALDVGCGSGALTIALAKRNPEANIVGMDKWGLSYKYFNKELCESNANAENVTNIKFISGDAVKMNFEDESFDAVVSNYVYHNIAGNRQEYLLETFRVLKKGGKFAIHDLFTRSKYGDMDVFVSKLKDMGFEKVELIATDDGTVMTSKEAKATMLNDSKLLIGIK